MGRQGLSTARKPAPIFFTTPNEAPQLNAWQKKVDHALNSIKESVEFAKNLPQAYSDSKSFMGKLFETNERSNALGFITSLAKNFTPHTNVSTSAAESSLKDLKVKTKALKKTAYDTTSIMNGAYLLVMNTIEQSYEQGYISRNPTSSQLYCLLSKRLGETTASEKKSSLQALGAYLNSVPNHEIKFGTLTNDAIMHKIEAQIAKIAPESSVTPGM